MKASASPASLLEPEAHTDRMRGALGFLVVLLAASPAAAVPAAPRVASVPLPRGASFWSVEPDRGQLLLTGTTTRSADCAWVTIEPRSLRVGAQASTSA